MDLVMFLIGLVLGFVLNLVLIEKTGDTLFGWFMTFLYRLKKND